MAAPTTTAAPTTGPTALRDRRSGEEERPGRGRDGPDHNRAPGFEPAREEGGDPADRQHKEPDESDDREVGGQRVGDEQRHDREGRPIQHREQGPGERDEGEERRSVLGGDAELDLYLHGPALGQGLGKREDRREGAEQEDEMDLERHLQGAPRVLGKHPGHSGPEAEADPEDDARHHRRQRSSLQRRQIDDEGGAHPEERPDRQALDQAGEEQGPDTRGPDEQRRGSGEQHDAEDHRSLAADLIGDLAAHQHRWQDTEHVDDEEGRQLPARQVEAATIEGEQRRHEARAHREDQQRPRRARRPPSHHGCLAPSGLSGAPDVVGREASRDVDRPPQGRQTVKGAVERSR